MSKECTMINWPRVLKSKIFKLSKYFLKLSQHKHSSWWSRLKDVLKTSFIFLFRRRLQDVLIKTNIFALAIPPHNPSSRRFQDVSSSYTVLVNTYLTRFWVVLRKRLSREKFTLVTLLRNFWPEHKISMSGLFGHKTLTSAFLKHFMKWLLLQTKIFLLKSGIRKDVVLVKNESVNKTGSKNVFQSF